VRKTRGDDIAAACGQLAGDVQDRTGVVVRMHKQRSAPWPGRGLAAVAALVD